MAGPKYRLLSQQAATMTFAYHGSSSCPLDNYQQGGRTSCNCCGPVNNLHAVDQLWKTNCYRELTLSGHIPGTLSRKTHLLVPTSVFTAVGLETFNVELDRTLWDVSILERMFLVNLKSLKLPISHPSDCVRLGRALTKMPRLVRLAITGFPNIQDFVSRLGHIGEGILNCASTLRELDFEMKNFDGMPLIETDEDGIFRKLFPCELMEEPSISRERSRLDTDSVVEAPLRLTKLRFKHLSLPWYSFGRVFDATTIKHIHLPCSMVDYKVWEVLETHVQLDTLTEINYDTISAEFLRFLSRQSSLKELIFMHPRDRCCAIHAYLYSLILSSDNIGMRYATQRGARWLGPGIVARDPSLEDFLCSLQHMKMLKHLVLPREMYTITSRSLICVAANLTELEHLEIGFDYEDRVSITTFFLQVESHRTLILAFDRTFSKRLLPISYVVCHH